MDWFVVSLLCAFGMASADAITKYALGQHSVTELVVMRFGLVALASTPLLAIYPITTVATQFWYWFALIVPAELLAAFLYIKALRLSPLSLTLPFLAFTPILIVLPAYLLLNETLTVFGGLGIVLVVSGAFVLQGNSAIGIGGFFRSLRAQRGSVLMLAVAGLYAITTVGAKNALQYAPLELFVPLYFWVLTGVSALWLARRRPVTRVPLSVSHVLLALSLGGATVAHFAGIQLVEVAYFIAVKRTSLLFGIVYGVVLFHEGPALRRLVAGLIMITGVILVTSSTDIQ